MSEEVNDVTENEVTEVETVDQQETVQETQEEQSFDPKKRYDVGDDPKMLVEKIKYENRQKKASDARNKMYWEMIQKQQERLDALEAKTSLKETNDAEAIILQKISEARENGETEREAKLLKELIDIKVDTQIKQTTKEKLPKEVKDVMGDPDVMTVVDRMNERDDNGQYLRPWMQTTHKDFKFAEAQANLIEAKMVSERGYFDLEEALDELDAVMRNRTAVVKQPALKKGPDPLSGSNLTNTQQKAKMKLSSEEERIAHLLGIKPENYLASKQKLQSAGKLK